MSQLEVLRDLAIALGRATTLSGVARWTFEALGAHRPVLGVEVARRRGRVFAGTAVWDEDDALELEAVRRMPDDTEAAVARLARRLGGQAHVSALRGVDGYVGLVARRDGVEVDLLHATAALIAGAVRHCAVLERTAACSRRAHEACAQLLDELVQLGAGELYGGRSPAMRRVDEQLALLVDSDSSALLVGEPGAGADRLARKLHRLSCRRGPLVRLDATHLPRRDVDRELFGARGRLARARRGTLQVDGFEALPLPAQERLAEEVGVGGSHGGVRLLGVTAADPRSLLDQGALARSLYFALSVVTIELPPLRERPEDIASLAAILAARVADRLGRPRPNGLDFAPLAERPWPGNIDELESALAEALLRAPDDPLGHLLASPAGRGDQPAAGESVPSLEQVVRAHIERALAHCRGRIYGDEGAAQLLGIPPSTLQGRLQRLGINRKEFTG